MQRFLINIQNDSLAFIVLISLLFGMIHSFLLIGKLNSINNFYKSNSILIVFLSVLGFPALIDLFKVGGFATFFSVIQIIILCFAIICAIISFISENFRAKASRWIKLLFLLLILGGFLTAGYLTFVEITAQPAICGLEYSGCTTVQSSQYAMLLGFMPVALFGLLGYLAIVVVWFALRTSLKNHFPFISYFQWGFTLFGVLFSTYLTYLEVFVIHATCSWCITSAVIMNLLLWISTLDINDYLLAKEELEDSEDNSGD